MLCFHLVLMEGSFKGLNLSLKIVSEMTYPGRSCREVLHAPSKNAG